MSYSEGETKRTHLNWILQIYFIEWKFELDWTLTHTNHVLASYVWSEWLIIQQGQGQSTSHYISSPALDVEINNGEDGLVHTCQHFKLMTQLTKCTVLKQDRFTFIQSHEHTKHLSICSIVGRVIARWRLKRLWSIVIDQLLTVHAAEIALDEATEGAF